MSGEVVDADYGCPATTPKAQQAELRGAKGVIIYSDPEDDGFGKGAVYPDGPWRRPTASSAARSGPSSTPRRPADAGHRLVPGTRLRADAGRQRDRDDPRHQVGYAVQYLPGMRDAIEQGDEQTARSYRDLLLDSLRDATRLAQRCAGSSR